MRIRFEIRKELFQLVSRLSLTLPDDSLVLLSLRVVHVASTLAWQVCSHNCEALRIMLRVVNTTLNISFKISNVVGSPLAETNLIQTDTHLLIV